jgi:6,7-dimethyl-8-ribityllumazine synthase
MYAASQLQSTSSAVGALVTSATDLLSSSSMTDLPSAAQQSSTSPAPPSQSDTSSTATFDAIIAIGCLIKGETMHFEYIADAVSHGLMRVQLESQVPVVFGVLTVLNEEQALMRAGVGVGGESGKEGHNHGLDWGCAAVELGFKRRGWGRGEMID